MNVTVTDTSETRKDLVVTVSGEEIATEETRVLKAFIKEAKIPGFRPGKAPENIVRSRYRKALQEELNRAMNAKVYQEATENSKLNVYSVVSFSEQDAYTPGQEVSVDLTVDVTPDFDLPEYKGIAIKAAKAEVSDEDVDKAIEHMRGQRADFKEVERPAAESDYVKLSYVGRIDGTPVRELLGEDSKQGFWGSVENGWEEAGTETAREYGIPEIVDGLVGKSAGDKFEVEHTFKDDFAVEDLRGKKAVYEVEVHEVRERTLPELDEDFFKSLQVESLEDLKDKLLTQLESQKKQESEQDKRNQIVDFLLAAVEFPLPQSGLEGETQNALGRLMVDNLQRGVPQEELEKNKAELHAQAREFAQRDVKLQLILGRIAKDESIEVENEDLQRTILNMAMQNRQSPEELVKELRKDRNRILQIQRQILFGKTLDLLVKEATVTESNE